MTSLKSRIGVLFALAVFGVGAISGAAEAQKVTAPGSVPQSGEHRTYDEFEELVQSAIDLFRQNKFDEALAICLKAAGMRPADFRPHYIAGLIYMRQLNMKSASDAVARAIALKPDDKRLYLLKASADRMRDARDEALLAIRKAIDLDPSFAEAYVMLGDTLAIGDKNRDEAIEAYRTAIKIDPGLLSGYGPLALLLSAAKDEKGVEEVYRKAMDADPGKMAFRFDLGRLLVTQGRLAEARVVWAGRTSDTDNTFPNFITLLERAEKLKVATDTLAQKPNDAEALLQMGLMVMDGESWVVDGRQDRAIGYFRKALAAKPGFAKAQYAICKAYVQLADTFKEKNKILDEELVKLKRLDQKLANELIEYRKTYSGGLRTITGR